MGLAHRSGEGVDSRVLMEMCSFLSLAGADCGPHISHSTLAVPRVELKKLSQTLKSFEKSVFFQMFSPKSTPGSKGYKGQHTASTPRRAVAPGNVQSPYSTGLSGAHGSVPRTLFPLKPAKRQVGREPKQGILRETF